MPCGIKLVLAHNHVQLDPIYKVIDLVVWLAPFALTPPHLELNLLQKPLCLVAQKL